MRVDVGRIPRVETPVIGMLEEGESLGCVSSYRNGRYVCEGRVEYTCSSSRAHDCEVLSPKLIHPKTGTEILRPLLPRRRYSHLVESIDFFREAGSSAIVLGAREDDWSDVLEMSWNDADAADSVSGLNELKVQERRKKKKSKAGDGTARDMMLVPWRNALD